MPTGVTLRDARARLLSAGERVLLRVGPAALTSRAVTDEAGVAKGVLHRHFVDFDDYVVALVRQGIATVEAVSADARRRVGTATVTANISAALIRLFDPLGLALVRLVLSRDDVRARLQTRTGQGLPVLSEAVDGLADYVVGEQRVGRIVAEAEPVALARAVVGTAHLLFAGELGGLPDESAVREIVESIVVGAEPGAGR